MFRRGFKTWAERTSLRVRENLRLSPSSPLDPYKLAELLAVSVVTPSDLAELPQDIQRRLIGDHRDCWSAITVSDGCGHLVVVNPSHARTRLNSSLSHEIAHIILGHEPSMMFMSPNSGMALRTHSEEQEEEAGWLSGCLLLPRDALVLARRTGQPDDDVCLEYGVSPSMLRFRLNVTGVNTQLRRTRRPKTGRRQ
jgi:hypothetical protein